jgi:hypothetical protein
MPIFRIYSASNQDVRIFRMIGSMFASNFFDEARSQIEMCELRPNASLLGSFVRVAQVLAMDCPV